MAWDEQASNAIYQKTRILIQVRNHKQIDDDINDIECTISKMISDKSLSMPVAVNILNTFLLLWQPRLAIIVMDYILKIEPEYEFIRRIRSHIFKENLTKHDVIRALYCLKSPLYDAMEFSQQPHLHGLLLNFIVKNKIDRGQIILDVGCGTGLVGLVLKQTSFCGTLIGIDISQEMISLAKETGCYSEIICCDIHNYMNSTSCQPFDTAICIGLGPLMDITEMEYLLVRLFEKCPRGPVIFNIPNAPDFRPTSSTTTTIEPILKKMRLRYRAVDDDDRRYYCCRR